MKLITSIVASILVFFHIQTTPSALQTPTPTPTPQVEDTEATQSAKLVKEQATSSAIPSTPVPTLKATPKPIIKTQTPDSYNIFQASIAISCLLSTHDDPSYIKKESEHIYATYHVTAEDISDYQYKISKKQLPADALSYYNSAIQHCE